MQKWAYIEGYEKRQVVDAETVNIAELKTDKEFVTAYAELSKARHYQDGSTPKGAANGKTANEKERLIVDEVRARLERAGWHAHIFKNGSCHEVNLGNGECEYQGEDYLHAFVGLPEIHQVAFSGDWNTELTEGELFNEDETLRTKEETLALLRERIGTPALDVDRMLKDGEITEETAEIVKGIIEAQGLTEIQEINEDARTIKAGSQEWTWRKDEDEAEDEARESLEEGEIWKEITKKAIDDGDTSPQSLDDWVDGVLDTDGWQVELCGYDGQSYDLDGGVVYWRTN